LVAFSFAEWTEKQCVHVWSFDDFEAVFACGEMLHGYDFISRESA
jgi:hypothetical protein